MWTAKSRQAWTGDGGGLKTGKSVRTSFCNIANFRVDLIGKVYVKFLLELASDD